MLSDNQVDRIHDLLLDHGVKYDRLRTDLLDHICCIVERQMSSGVSFESALKFSVNAFGENGLRRTHEATIHLLTLKLKIMRKVMSIFGLIGGLLTSNGVFFKMMHWPGADISLVLGILAIVFLYLPLLIFIKIKEANAGRLKAIYTSGIFGAIIHGLGVLFKLMHWPGGSQLMIISIAIIGLVFMPLYFTYNYKLAENKLSSLAFSAVLFSGIFLLYGITSLSAG